MLPLHNCLKKHTNIIFKRYTISIKFNIAFLGSGSVHQNEEEKSYKYMSKHVSCFVCLLFSSQQQDTFLGRIEHVKHNAISLQCIRHNRYKIPNWSCHKTNDLLKKCILYTLFYLFNCELDYIFLSINLWLITNLKNKK